MVHLGGHGAQFTGGTADRGERVIRVPEAHEQFRVVPVEPGEFLRGAAALARGVRLGREGGEFFQAAGCVPESMSVSASSWASPLRAEDDLHVGVAGVQVTQDRGLASLGAGEQRARRSAMSHRR